MNKQKKGMHGGLANYGDPEFSLFLRKAFIKSMGYSDDALDRPIIGVTNTFSGYNGCHRTVPDLVQAISRGVMLAGGLPIEFPVLSVHESFSSPTSMYLRNLMSMSVEEMIRAQPMDAVVMIGGCDKTVPALLMAAASAGVPALMTVTGPMLTGSFRGERIGACTDCRRLWQAYRAGELDEEEITGAGNSLMPTAGTCGVMGTASSMALITEVMGMMLSGGATIPAPMADRLRHAEASGQRAVALAAEETVPKDIMTPAAFRNALRLLHAIGGSTNALVHLAAIAGRCGIKIDLEAFGRLGESIPVLVDLKPSGKYYMEDLFRAGGLQPILCQMRHLLELDTPTVSGRTLGEEMDAAPSEWQQEVVRHIDNPLSLRGALRVLRGNLAPRGAIIKSAAATQKLLKHRGRAVVFHSIEDLDARIDSEDLDVRADDVLVLSNAGPLGAPGMPEAGSIPIPRKLGRQGVKDMVRLSDARMSGTAFGTIILHATPEAAAGGVIGLVRDGDIIELDVDAGRIELLVDEADLERRRDEGRPTTNSDPAAQHGYRKLFLDEVNQADEGCDFRFLVGTGDMVCVP